MFLDCQDPNNIGAICEAAVKQYLDEKGYSITDVSKNKEYWLQDVDLLATKGASTLKIEVKGERQIHKYQSFFIELMADEERNKAGWIDITKADYIFYMDGITFDCYVFKPQDMRNYLAKNSYSIKRCYKDGYKVSVGAIVPITPFAEQYELHRIKIKVSNKT